MLKKIVFILILISVFCSCSTIPKGNNKQNKSLVMLVIDTSEMTVKDIPLTYELIYDENKSIKIDITKKYQIISKIPIGRHIINRIVINNNSTISKQEAYFKNADFEILEGTITILNFTLVVRTLIDQPESLSIGSSIRNLSNEEYSNAIIYFHTLPNSEEWIIFRSQ